MKLIIISLSILVGTLIWLNSNEPSTPIDTYNLPANQLSVFRQVNNTSNEHPCLNRSRCLVLYLSPWCPSCRQTKHFVPFVREAIAQKDAGLVVVVGKAWGNFNGGYQMARDIGGQVFVDDKSEYWREIRKNVRAIPAWLVIGSNGEVRKTRTGSPREYSIVSAKAFLSKLSID